MDLGKILHKDAKILVAGLGYRTGLTTANFLAERDFSVDVCDVKTADALAEISSKLAKDVRLYAGTQDVSLLENGYDLVVLSPGVPASIPLITGACAAGVPVIAEVELAYFYTKGLWIAITGTDGKSTTTAMTGYVLEKLGFDSRIGGNIGIPLISLADGTSDSTVTVAELSSFQLETVKNFHPRISAITNMASDHLDRYDSMDDYFGAKMNITCNQNEKDFFLLNLDDRIILNGTGGVTAAIMSYSLNNGNADIYFRDGSVFFRSDGTETELFKISTMFIPGMHNVQNAMICFLIVFSLHKILDRDIDIAKIVQFITEFPGLEHRMEIYREFRGRRFINDSKATTVGAVEVALNSLDSNSVFILGGRGKGDNYSKLAEVMRDRVRGVVLIGETREQFENIFSEFRYVSALSMEEAVRLAFDMSSEGDTVILSPSCASFDMYENFEQRGRDFKRSVDMLAGDEI